MLLNPLTYHAPRTAPEAAKLIGDLGEVKILAGGTFVLNSLKLLKRKGAKTPRNVVSLRKVENLKGTELSDNKLIVRAMTVINELFEDPHLVDNFRVLRTVCRNISTNPIRNMATVGGNLTCRYTWTEMGAVMIALGAKMHFLDAEGKDVVIDSEEFFKNAAKSPHLFTHVEIPRDADATVAYRRVKKTIDVDVPLLCICIKSRIKDKRFNDTRVTVNNGTQFAQRDSTLEEFLDETPITPAIAQEALDHLTSAIYDTRSDDYKKHMFRVSIKSAIEELAQNASR